MSDAGSIAGSVIGSLIFIGVIVACCVGLGRFCQDKETVRVVERPVAVPVATISETRAVIITP